MRKKTKVWTTVGLSCLCALFTAGIFAENAYAYTLYPNMDYGNVVMDPSGSLEVQGGEQLNIGPSDAGNEPGLAGQSVNTFVSDVNVNGGNAQQIPDFDIVGETVNDGYPMVGPWQTTANAEGTVFSGNIGDWVSRLGGNPYYVYQYLSGVNGEITASSNSGYPYSFVDFSDVVMTSGATMTYTTVPTGATNAEGEPIYHLTYNVTPTAPPTAESVQVSDGDTGASGTVQEGDPLDITVTSQQNVSNSAYNHHYDAVELINQSTGQATWIAGSGSQHVEAMEEEPGAYGTLTDNLTDNNTNALVPGTYTVNFYTTDAVHRPASLPATTTLTVTSGANGGGGGGSQNTTITLSASPIALPTGQSSTLTATVHGLTAGELSNNEEYVEIVDQSGDDTLSGQNSVDGYNTTLTTTATDNQPQTVTYVAEIVNFNTGQAVAGSEAVTVQWSNAQNNAPPPPPATISFSPSQNEYLKPGQMVDLSYTTSNFQSGDYVVITPSGNGVDAWDVGHRISASGHWHETETPDPGHSVYETYSAAIVNAEGQIVDQVESGTLEWVAPAPPKITLTASPTQLTSGQDTVLSYSVTNFKTGDYVRVVGTGDGSDEWQETHDTSAYGADVEVEKPYNGHSTTVHYVATVYNASGMATSTSNVTVTWTSTAPSITLSANPTTMVPGQPSTIAYTATSMGGGDYVDVVAKGNGADMWDVSDQENASESDREVESPGPGQTISVTYTATVYTKSGLFLTDATTSVKWVNAWDGQVTLTAKPVDLPTGSATTLTATTTQPIPSGYTLRILDETTQQLLRESGSAPLGATYTAYAPQTDTYDAYVVDSYEHVGPASQPVSVVWSNLSLSASPTQLPEDSTSTLTVQGTNVPAGDYLILYDETTGQYVSFSKTTNLQVPQTFDAPTVNTYIAYINSTPTLAEAYAVSNPVTVDWYGVSLVVDPSRLPIDKDSTLTAKAQDLPSGYVLEILDKTTGAVLATGQPGQTLVETEQTSSVPLTNDYVAEVVEPSNPEVPNLPVPSSGSQTEDVHGNGQIWAATPNSVAYWTGSSWEDTGDPDLSTVYALTYNRSTHQVWAGTADGAAYWNGSSWIDAGTYWGSKVPVTGLAYDAATGDVWATTYEGVAYWNGSGWVGIDALPGGGPVGLEATNTVVSLAYDSENNVMYASDTDGEVAYWNGSAWVSAGTEHGDGPLYYDASDNRLYAGSYTYGGIGWIPGLGNTWTTVNNASADWGIQAITGSGTTVYNGTYNNYVLYQWTYGNASSTGVTSQGSDAIALAVSNQGNVWAGTDSSGVYRYDPVTNSVTDISSQVDGSSEVVAMLNTGDLTYESDTSAIQADVPQDTPTNGFSEDTPYNTEEDLVSGVYGQHVYTAPGNQNITSVTATLETNMFGYNGGTYYSNPFIKAYNAAGQSIGVDNIQTTYDYPETQTVQWSPPAGTKRLAFGWQYNSGYSGAVNWTAEWSHVQVQLGTPGTRYFPIWTFQAMPSVVPQSLFPHTAVASTEAPDMIWSTENASGDVPNGTVFFQRTFNVPTKANVNFTITGVDDYMQVYVDGFPLLQEGNAANEVGGDIPYGATRTVTLNPGPNQVIIEASNTNGFGGSNPNPAEVGLTAETTHGDVLFTTDDPSEWTTTGYVTQLPQGWFHGAVGTYPYTEYVMQEQASQPVYAQQSYTVTTTAQDVSAWTYPPLAITWFRPIVPPDNFELQALPSHVTWPGNTTFKVTFDATDANFVNQNLHGKANVVILQEATGLYVAHTTWDPATQGDDVDIPYHPTGGSDLRYLAWLQPIGQPKTTFATSNSVRVSSQGDGRETSTYSTMGCGGSGDGTEIFYTYVNGKVTSTRKVPLDITHLEIDGYLNPPHALKRDWPPARLGKLPILPDEVDGYTIPLRVQSPYAFAVDFPDAQPTRVVATFQSLGNYPVNQQGDTSWTVNMKPTPRLGFGFWQGVSIVPKQPDGAYISVTITAYDDCGVKTLYDQMFLKTSGRPMWYFVGLSKP
ncbi:hypothetical protein [Alicyclobacillus sp. SP_1]|uniref:hypothetical protein n=1 Tax=Alicyclobacillus sp. SP_1 TaxID=2942475 RepID=UPI002157926A|nr:hypothetical protein [Alicyclobacillus sp. SP_1]